jgi:acyl-coenzyme A thioesterase PaaI-like protein
VINNGKQIKVVESEVFSISDEVEKLVSKSMFTQMAVLAENLKTD